VVNTSRAPGFLDIVKSAWLFNNDYMDAIQTFTILVKKWNIDTFGNLFKRKDNLLRHINGIQKMDQDSKNNFHNNLKTSLINEFKEILKQEEDFWKIKSRVQWLDDRDANTIFFSISPLLTGDVKIKY